MRIHNKDYPKAKVSLSDLKAVYRHGATMRDENRPLGVRALARVGMYLRMKIGYSEEGFKNLLCQVELKNSLDYMKNSSIDISDSLLVIKNGDFFYTKITKLLKLESQRCSNWSLVQIKLKTCCYVPKSSSKWRGRSEKSA